MRSRAWVAGAALFVLTACELEKVGIPRTDKFLSMHAVLSASASTQVVLLERTRNGSVLVVGPGFDLADPIVSDAGIAETGARVVLTMPGGQTLVAREDNTVRDDGKGQGIYRFTLPGSALQRGATYSLAITTSKGELMSAETSMPGGSAAMVAEQRVFDRSRDTLSIEWPAAPNARSYFVRIETPYGPRSFFTDSTRITLSGELRHTDIDELPHVFFPGFPQAVTVSAVDSNYYDWYRTHNNTLSGAGLLSRVTGGFGLFGSLVRLRYQDLRVVVPQVEQVAGRFVFVGTAAEQISTPFSSMELFVESRAARGDQADALSGKYDVRPRFGYTGCYTCGLFGSVKDGKVEIAFLRDWFASDTSEILSGEIRGDTIVGKYRGFGGIVHFVKQH